jgi:hydroxymethylpyrimidine/phosphomethylpyrimidine kinase
MASYPYVCLTIGGSDSSAGAGIQADLATFNAFGLHGCSAITALTAQNPKQVTAVQPASLEQLEAQIRAVFDYYPVAAVKTGMLYDAERVALVAELMQKLHSGKPLIVDPVMISTSGAALLDESAVTTLEETLFPLATLIIPNLPEAAALLGREVDDSVEDADTLMMRYRAAILLKGGHSDDEFTLIDTLCEPNGVLTPIAHPKQEWGRDRAHGTGCRLASAIAAGLARGQKLPQAVNHAIDWLQGK